MALDGLPSHFKEKLEGFNCYSLNQLQLWALNQEYRFKKAKDAYKTHRFNTGLTPLSLFGLTPSSYASLKPIQKNRKEDIKFTFDVSKCNQIFDEFLRLGHTKITHTIPPL